VGASLCVCAAVLQVLLSAARALPLYPELALLHSRHGDHAAALMLLALLPPRLVEGAIAYCRCVYVCECRVCQRVGAYRSGA
jgi:hypothetical protein